MISTEQRIVIRKICQLQIDSMKEVKRDHSIRLFNELYDEGYEVDLNDILEECDRIVAQWLKVKNKPDKFMQILDDQQQGMLKHHLINEFEQQYPAKGVWKTINIFERLKKYQNNGGLN